MFSKSVNHQYLISFLKGRPNNYHLIKKDYVFFEFLFLIAGYKRFF